MIFLNNIRHKWYNFPSKVTIILCQDNLEMSDLKCFSSKCLLELIALITVSSRHFFCVSVHVYIYINEGLEVNRILPQL